MDAMTITQKSQPASVDPTRILRRLAATEDEPFLFAVYAATREEEMALVNWGEEEKSRFVRSQFLAQKTDYEQRFPDSTHEIVLLGEKLIGRIWVDRRQNEIRLLDLALLPAFRNRGVGAALIGQLQNEAARLDKALRHCVLRVNESAIRFYKRLGFVRIDEAGMHDLMQWRPGE